MTTTTTIRSLPHLAIHPYQHFLVLYPCFLPAFPEKVGSCLLSVAAHPTEAAAIRSSLIPNPGIFPLPGFSSIFLLGFKHA